MKTTILTLAILTATVFGIKQSASAAISSKEEVNTIFTDMTSINKIEVHGNVELHLSAGAVDKIKVYNHYYAESALVQDKNGVLRVTSYGAQKLIVWVTVSDLRELEVYDNAEIKSFGKLSAIDLDIKLYNRASAQLEMDTYAAKVTLNDHAKAVISGNADEADLSYNRCSFFNTAGLVAFHLVKSVKLNRIYKSDNIESAAL
jgi:sporulation protein YlmC with PRC-barrel domain